MNPDATPPTGLAHPLAGLQVPKGSPWAVREVAAQFRASAGGMRAARDQMKSGVESVCGSSWVGLGSLAAARAAASTWALADACAQSYEQAAGALDAYAAALDAALEQFLKAGMLAQDALRAEAQAQAQQQADPLGQSPFGPAVGSPFHPASASRFLARSLAVSALADVEEAGNRAAATLAALAGLVGERSPDRPGGVKGLWAGAKDSVAESASGIWGLTPFGDAPKQAWSNLGAGLKETFTSWDGAKQSGKEAVNWDEFAAGNIAYGVGGLIPSLLGTKGTTKLTKFKGAPDSEGVENSRDLAEHLREHVRRGDHPEADAIADFAARTRVPDRLSEADAARFDAWAKENVGDVQKGTSDWAKYQRQVAGDQEYRVHLPNGKTYVEPDGLLIDAGYMHEAKFGQSDGSSAHSLANNMPPHVKEFIDGKLESQFAKRLEVIYDPNNPVRGLTITTPTPESMAYLIERLRAANVPPELVHLRLVEYKSGS